MMKSIYGKLICGFLITIVFSFSVAGYVALRSNYDQIADMAQNELSATSEYVVGILNSLEDTNINDIMDQYAISSEINITLYSPNYGYYTYGGNKYAPSKEMMKRYYYDDSKNGYYAEQKSIQSYGSKTNIRDMDVYVYVQKDTSYEKSIFANSAVLILGCVFLSGNLVFIAIADIIVKPITRLTNATKELSKGNYSVRVNYVGDDEISRLNQGFNQMAQQLAKQEETRQKFISDISHEFQTPLTAIQGFANILKEEDLPKEQRQKYADIILFHSKRLSTLSKNMLQLTLLEREEVELEFTTFSIVEQLLRVISTQENQAIFRVIVIVPSAVIFALTVTEPFTAVPAAKVVPAASVPPAGRPVSVPFVIPVPATAALTAWFCAMVWSVSGVKLRLITTLVATPPLTNTSPSSFASAMA